MTQDFRRPQVGLTCVPWPQCVSTLIAGPSQPYACQPATPANLTPPLVSQATFSPTDTSGRQ
jgi:hypothetical protein